MQGYGCSLTAGRHATKCELAEKWILLYTVYQRWQATVDWGDPAQIVVVDISEHHALDGGATEGRRVHWIEFLFV